MMKRITIGLVLVFAVNLSSCAAPDTPLPPTQTATKIPPTNIATPIPHTETPTPLPPTQTPTLPPICQTLEDQDPPSDLDGEELVSGMVERLNAGDVPGAMAYFAQDARMFTIGLPPAGFEEAIGFQAVCGALANTVNDNLEIELRVTSAHNSEDGTLISAKSKIWQDSNNLQDGEPLEFASSFYLQNGKILEFSSTLMEESLASLRSTLAEGEEFTIPEIPGATEAAGSAFKMTFDGFSCRYDGPAVWQAGTLDIYGEVKDDQSYGLVFVNIDQEKDYYDLAAVSGSHVPPWARYSMYDYGPKESRTDQRLLVGGTSLYIMCLMEKAITTPVGLFGPFEIEP